MASNDPVVVDDGIVEPGIEPGASAETMLVTTDSFEEYEQEVSSSIDDRSGDLAKFKRRRSIDDVQKETTASTLSEIPDDTPKVTSTTKSSAVLEQNHSLDDGEMVCFITFLNSDDTTAPIHFFSINFSLS